MDCGLFGIYNHPDASKLTYLGLYSLQHRGEESAGIVSADGRRMHEHKGMELVADIFKRKELFEKLSGNIAIGHNRYSTTGSNLLKNCQPLLINCSQGSVAIAHNGNLVNAKELRKKMEAVGSIFQTTTDSEIIIHLLAHSRQGFEQGLIKALREIKGAFSLLILTKDTLIGARDPYGFHPLCLGKLSLNKKNSYILTSETCSLDLIEAEYVCDVKPGEIIFINKKGIRKTIFSTSAKPKFCIFEYIYFARPDSNIFGYNVYLVRKELGRKLAREKPASADIVMSIPDSGNYAAIGYSQESGIPLEYGFIRNHYVGRTFLQPLQSIRDFKVRIKLNPVKQVIKGKRVVVVDDSIVRGTTSRRRIRALREAGAKEVHMRISCPPHRFPCFYGIDFPTSRELIATNKSEKEICQFIGADSLGYLTMNGLLQSMPSPATNYCLACFNGKYPVKNKRKGNKFALEKNAIQD